MARARHTICIKEPDRHWAARRAHDVHDDEEEEEAISVVVVVCIWCGVL